MTNALLITYYQTIGQILSTPESHSSSFPDLRFNVVKRRPLFMWIFMALLLITPVLLLLLMLNDFSLSASDGKLIVQILW